MKMNAMKNECRNKKEKERKVPKKGKYTERLEARNKEKKEREQERKRNE